MKKLLYLLCALPLLFIAACGSDNDKLPQFDVQVAFAPGVNVSDGVITVPQGQTFTIDSIKPINSTAKKITFGTVTYQIDFGMGYRNIVQPYTTTFETMNLPVGRHILRIYIGVYAVDYAPANAIVSYYLNVTEPVSGGNTPDSSDSTAVVTIAHPAINGN